jgi:hypothetical protein
VEAERRQDTPQVWLTVRDQDGDVVRRLEGVNKKGFHRIAWDLKYPPTDVILDEDDVDGGYASAMTAPGDFTVTLSKQVDGIVTELSPPIPFKVQRLYEGAVPGADPEMVAAFWRELERLNRSTAAAREMLRLALDRVDLLQKALARTHAPPGSLESDLHKLKQSLLVIDEQLFGNRSKRQIGEKRDPTLRHRQWVAWESVNSTHGPTATQRRSLEIAVAEFRELKQELQKLVNTDMPRVEQAMRDAGAPWMEGQPIPEY